MLFAGSEPQMVDFHVWPFIERLPMIKLFTPNSRDALPKGKFPNVDAWFNSMVDLPAVKELYIKPEQFAEFNKGFVIGKPVFDP